MSEIKTYAFCPSCGGSGKLELGDVVVDCNECLRRYIKDLQYQVMELEEELDIANTHLASREQNNLECRQALDNIKRKTEAQS